ncbi:MAG TPA: phosphate ABC transporter ATP-binding protein [Mycobacteriales bacterium]|nr:phosphate ABC transporter ATP-binding protein [Mycobacteriales bacterium]
MAARALFRLDDVTTTRGHGDDHVHPLSGVTAVVPEGGITVVVGPSGSGKTTLLRLLNRMEEPTGGTVLLDEQPLRSLDVLELRRRVGLLLQVPTPFPGSVLDNLRVGRPGVTEAEAGELLGRVGLPDGFAARDALSLSGGEAQRVCLARALAVGPRVLLLDEPTSALDPDATRAVEGAVRRLVADGLTAVWVCHDQLQARRLADHVIVVHSGEVADQGPADRVFSAPAGERARAFIASAT